MTVRLDRSDVAIAAILLLAGATVCFLVFRSGPWGLRPAIEDEFVYLFQAKELAAGHLSYPPPPIPDFFEAAHILVVPRFAAKYLPGHAAVLAPFVAIGVPWLAPCLLLGATAALLFLCARAAGLSPLASAIAPGLLLGTPNVFRWFGSYLSQTSSILWVAATALAFVRVRARASPARVLCLSACVVAAGLTRPFTGLALLVAAAAVLTRMRPPLRIWLLSLAPLLAGAVVVATVSRTTTGSWTTPPWVLYARQYMPFDGPGIGRVADVQPERVLPAHLQALSKSFADSRKSHTLSRLPRETLRRVDTVARLLPGWPLFAFAIVGIWFSPLSPLAVFAAAYFLLQLTFHAGDSFYHLDLVPWLALSTAAGIQLTVRHAARMRPAVRTSVAIAAVAATALTLASLLTQATALFSVQLPARGEIYARCDRVLGRIHDRRALVFIRYPRGWNSHDDLTWNEPDLAHARVIRAIDLGSRDAELMNAFPDRAAYRFDPLLLTLEPL